MIIAKQFALERWITEYGMVCRVETSRYIKGNIFEWFKHNGTAYVRTTKSHPDCGQLLNLSDFHRRMYFYIVDPQTAMLFKLTYGGDSRVRIRVIKPGIGPNKFTWV